MKKLALVLTFCCLLLGTSLGNAQAHHLPGDNYQFGFGAGDFYFQFGPNGSYFGWNNGYRYRDPYRYAPYLFPDYYYYSPPRRYYSPPRRYYAPRRRYYAPPPPIFYFPY